MVGRNENCMGVGGGGELAPKLSSLLFGPFQYIYVFFPRVQSPQSKGMEQALSPPQRPPTVALGRNARRLGRGKV